jgi:hypothetical protein
MCENWPATVVSRPAPRWAIESKRQGCARSSLHLLLAHSDLLHCVGRASQTGHCGRGWTCSLPRPVANDPERTIRTVIHHIAVGLLDQLVGTGRPQPAATQDVTQKLQERRKCSNPPQAGATLGE